MTIRRIPAEFWRGGTSKGIFLLEHDLPSDAAHRDRLLLRMIGSPDPYGKQIDGMGGATSSTSKIVLIRRSSRADCDVEYLFGAVDIHRPIIDWSGNCGNLTTAVGPLALSLGLVAASEGTTVVRLWQDNIGKRILAHVPVIDGRPAEEGDFLMDGVAFPAPEILLEFLDPGGGESAMLPTGNVVDTLDVPGVGTVEATLVNAGNPTVFVHASTLGLTGLEMPPAVNADTTVLARCEAIRSHAAVTMGLAVSAASATRDRPATPKLSFVAAPATYVASSGREVRSEDISLVARILSMGALHHAYTGTGAVALAVAAALPGSVVARAARGGSSDRIRIGHVAGTLTAGAEVRRNGADWSVTRALMSRSARRLMSGTVHVPEVQGGTT